LSLAALMHTAVPVGLYLLVILAVEWPDTIERVLRSPWFGVVVPAHAFNCEPNESRKLIFFTRSGYARSAGTPYSLSVKTEHLGRHKV